MIFEIIKFKVDNSKSDAAWLPDDQQEGYKIEVPYPNGSKAGIILNLTNSTDKEFQIGKAVLDLLKLQS